MAVNSWNFEPKLSVKILSNLFDIASLTKQIIRGTKSNEVCLLK